MSQQNLEGGSIRNMVHVAQLKLGTMSDVLAGTMTMANKFPPLLFLDPGGADRDVLLPPEEEGLMFIIVNTADAAEDLVIKEDSGTTTICTALGTASGALNERAILVCDGTSWFGMIMPDTA